MNKGFYENDFVKGVIKTCATLLREEEEARKNGDEETSRMLMKEVWAGVLLLDYLHEMRIHHKDGARQVNFLNKSLEELRNYNSRTYV